MEKTAVEEILFHRLAYRIVLLPKRVLIHYDGTESVFQTGRTLQIVSIIHLKELALETLEAWVKVSALAFLLTFKFAYFTVSDANSVFQPNLVNNFSSVDCRYFIVFPFV